MSDTIYSNTAHDGMLGRTVGAIQSLGRRFVDYRRFRQTVNELSVLNDRELRDLGLDRCSLTSVAREAVYQGR